MCANNTSCTGENYSVDGMQHHRIWPLTVMFLYRIWQYVYDPQLSQSRQHKQVNEIKWDSILSILLWFISKYKCLWQNIAAWYVTCLNTIFPFWCICTYFWGKNTYWYESISIEWGAVKKILLRGWEFFYFHQWILRAPTPGLTKSGYPI